MIPCSINTVKSDGRGVYSEAHLLWETGLSTGCFTVRKADYGFDFYAPQSFEDGNGDAS